MEEAKEKTKPDVLGAPLKRAKRAVRYLVITPSSSSVPRGRSRPRL